MKNITLIMYKYRVLFNFLPIVLGILYFFLFTEQIYNKMLLFLASLVLFVSFCLRFWVAMYNWENINSDEPKALSGIITNGPYSLCRNPMYLSATIMVIGFSLIFSSLEITLIMTIPTLLLHFQQIAIEEEYLSRILEKDIYGEYKRKVPCFIPYKGRTNGIKRYGKANWKRGIQNDSGPLFGEFVFIILIWTFLPFFQYNLTTLFVICLITVVVNMIVHIKIKESAKKVKVIPSTAPHHVLTMPLRYIVFSPKKFIIRTNLLSEKKITVMDLGCGPGFYTLQLAKMVEGKVIAFDIRDKMLEIVKKKALKKQLDNIEYIIGNSDNLPLKDQSVDVICIYLVLGEIVNINQTICECKRVLKDNGKISVMENIFDDHYQNIEEVKQLFGKEGWSLKVVEKKKTYYVLEIIKK